MKHALIVGAGAGLSASLARKLFALGWQVALAARDAGKLDALATETGATIHACDSADPAQVEALFTALPAPELVVYNPSFRTRGPIATLDPALVRRALEVCAFGAFLVAQQAARRMLEAGHGTILLTGASAGVKGFAESAPFAMGKFALRGLGESLSRELHPKNIHVCHFTIDGGIASATRAQGNDTLLDPDAIADSYLHVLAQPRTAWSSEMAIRPWGEKF